MKQKIRTLKRKYTKKRKNRKIWFVGDRCETGGNDKEIYDLINKEERAFKTKR